MGCGGGWGVLGTGRGAEVNAVLILDDARLLIKEETGFILPGEAVGHQGRCNGSVGCRVDCHLSCAVGQFGNVGVAFLEPFRTDFFIDVRRLV